MQSYADLRDQSGRRGFELATFGPQPNALPSCATPRSRVTIPRANAKRPVRRLVDARLYRPVTAPSPFGNRPPASWPPIGQRGSRLRADAPHHRRASWDSRSPRSTRTSSPWPWRAPRRATRAALHFLYVRFADDVCGLRGQHRARAWTGPGRSPRGSSETLMTAIQSYEPREVPFAVMDPARRRADAALRPPSRS